MTFVIISENLIRVIYYFRENKIATVIGFDVHLH